MKVGRTYHLFTSEMAGDPVWVRMKLGVLAQQRQAALDADRDAVRVERRVRRQRSARRALVAAACLRHGDRRWNLFYVAYRAAPKTSTQFRMNHEGRIWRAVSSVQGRAASPARIATSAWCSNRDRRPSRGKGCRARTRFFPTASASNGMRSTAVRTPRRSRSNTGAWAWRPRRRSEGHGAGIRTSTLRRSNRCSSRTRS